jgi:VCBS repeat protein
VTAGILAAGGLLAAGLLAGQDGEALAKRYGWTGPEVYKFHLQTTGLRAADLNGDGRTDLVFADNDRARIEVMLQRAPEEQAKPQPPPEDDGPNSILEPGRFRRAPVAVEAKVHSLATGDFTGEGRTDLAWFGDDNRLVIAAGQPDGTFARAREWKIEEGSSARAALAAADLNGDGRSDLALLGGKESRVLLSGPEGSFAEPARYPASTEKANALSLVDLDGDRALDLVLVAPDEERPIRVRFGSSAGTFGPEIPLKLPPIRTATFADADGDGKAEVFAIHRTSGRVGMYVFEPPAREKARFPFGSVRYHAFEASKGGPEKGRGIALGDLDGDGRPDVLVSEPAGARLVLYRGRPDGGFEEGESFPSFVDGRAVRIADFDGDGRYEAAVLSVEEKAIGLSRFAEGRMTFPRAIPLEGTPAALDASDLDGDGKADLAVARRAGKGEHALVVFRHAASGLEPAKTLPLPELPTDPTGLLLVDLDGDRRRDVVLFMPRESARIVLNGEGLALKDLAGADARQALTKGVRDGSWSRADVEGDGREEMLVARDHFARALRIGAGGALEVLDQFNGPTPESQVFGALAADLDGDGRPEVALLDRKREAVVLLARGAKGFEGAGEVEVGALSFRGAEAADLDGDSRPDLLLFAEDRFAVVPSRASESALVETAQYESTIPNAFYEKALVGDANADGRPDLVLLETGSARLDLLAVEGRGLRHALQFRVFEQRSFEQQRRSSEPREALLADVTGDGKADLALLVHDRLLLYPQE